MEREWWTIAKLVGHACVTLLLVCGSAFAFYFGKHLIGLTLVIFGVLTVLQVQKIAERFLSKKR